MNGLFYIQFLLYTLSLYIFDSMYEVYIIISSLWVRKQEETFPNTMLLSSANPGLSNF